MKKLSKDEMKKVLGAVAQVSCSCYGSIGSWEYTSTPTDIESLEDISSYCRSGYGSCTNGASIMPV